MIRTQLLLPLFPLALLLSCPMQKAQERKEGQAGGPKGNPDYVRLVVPPQGKGHLDTALVTFRDGKGRTLDLVGAVHLGEKSYYQALNLLFTKYDALLYELIAPRDHRPPNRRRGGNLLSMIQGAMGDKLGLAFQLDEIDYGKANFVHADLTPKKFARKWKEKGGFLKLFLRTLALQGELNKRNDPEDSMKMMIALLTSSKPDYLRFLFAKQMRDMDLLNLLLDGKDGALIGARNAAALKALRRQLAAGHKRLGLFYGAAHMGDMEERLEQELGFVKVRTRWLRAWSFTLTPPQRKAFREKQPPREAPEKKEGAAGKEKDGGR